MYCRCRTKIILKFQLWGTPTKHCKVDNLTAKVCWKSMLQDTLHNPGHQFFSKLGWVPFIPSRVLFRHYGKSSPKFGNHPLPQEFLVRSDGKCQTLMLYFHNTHTHTHSRLMAFFQAYLGRPVPEGWTILDFLKQRWWGGSGISRTVCKSFACLLYTSDAADE